MGHSTGHTGPTSPVRSSPPLPRRFGDASARTSSRISEVQGTHPREPPGACSSSPWEAPPQFVGADQGATRPAGTTRNPATPLEAASAPATPGRPEHPTPRRRWAPGHRAADPEHTATDMPSKVRDDSGLHRPRATPAPCFWPGAAQIRRTSEDSLGKSRESGRVGAVRCRDRIRPVETEH